MAASDAIPVPRKNTAYRFYFAIRKPSDSTLITTWAGMDSEVSKDGAAYADCTNEATEIGTTGTGYIDLTASEMNADCVLLKVTVTNSGAVPLVFAIYPEEVGDYRANAAQVGGQPASASGTVTFPNATLASTTNITAAAGCAVSSIGANAITAASINTGAITAAKFAASAIDATAIAANAITSAKIATGAITSTQFAAGAINAAAIAADAITDAKVASDVTIASVTGAVGSVTGNVGGNVVGSVGSVSSFGTLVSDIATAVWEAGTRTLTAIGDSSGITTLLTRIVGTIASGTHNPQSGDAFARLGAPAGASTSADIAAVQATATNTQTFAANCQSYLVTLVGRVTSSAAQLFVDLVQMIAGSGTADAKWTVKALEDAPAGGGGGGSGDASQATLLQVKAKTDLITASNVQFNSMVNTEGYIDGEIIIGDDYLAANGRAFQWTFTPNSGFVAATSSCKFGGSNASGTSTWLVTGTVTDNGNGTWTISFDLPLATTSTLLEGMHEWSAECISATNVEITKKRSGKKVKVVRKWTN